MTPRSQSATEDTQHSLMGRLANAIGLSPQSKRQSRQRSLDQTEGLESRQMLSAAGANHAAVSFNYNFPIAEPAPNVAQQANVNAVDVQNQTFTVPENTANGTLVGTVVAFDPDTSTPLTYAITAGNTNGAFAINAANGKVTVANSAALNYEAQTSFSLTVLVTDPTNPVTTDTAVVTINVTNIDEPTSITLQSTPITYQLGNDPLIIDPTAVLNPDPETPNPSYKNARLVVGVEGPRLSTLDVIRVVSQGDGQGQIRATSTQIYYEGKAIASYRGGRGADPKLTISFYSTATDASVQALLRRVAFNTKTHTNPAPDRTISFRLINVGGQNAPTVSRVVKVARPTST